MNQRPAPEEVEKDEGDKGEDSEEEEPNYEERERNLDPPEKRANMPPPLLKKTYRNKGVHLPYHIVPYADHHGNAVMILVALIGHMTKDSFSSFEIINNGERINISFVEPCFLTDLQLLSQSQCNSHGEPHFDVDHPMTIAHHTAVSHDLQKSKKNIVECHFSILLPFKVKPRFFNDDGIGGVDFVHKQSTGELCLILHLMQRDFALEVNALSKLAIPDLDPDPIDPNKCKRL